MDDGPFNLLAQFLGEFALYASLELFISGLLEIPYSPLLYQLLCPVFMKPTALSREILYYLSYATALSCIFEFLGAFSDLPTTEAGEYQVAAHSWPPITAADYNEPSIKDEWGDIAPSFVFLHHVYMIFVFCFIGMSGLCGLMIHFHLPPWDISSASLAPFVRWFQSVANTASKTSIFLLKSPQHAYTAAESILGWLLDPVFGDRAVFLSAGSSGIILFDAMLAIWAADLVLPNRSSEEICLFESRPEVSGPDFCFPVLTWHFGHRMLSLDGWNIDLEGKIRKCIALMETFPTRFEHWYNSQHEHDKIHHCAVLTVPIVVILVLVACKLLWEAKPPQLRRLEHVVEETLLKDTITYDYQDYLRTLKGKVDTLMGFIASNLKVSHDLVAQNRYLMNQRAPITAELHKLQKRLTEEARKADSFFKQSLELRGANKSLLAEVNKLRLSADFQANAAKIESLNDQISSLQKQNVSLQKEVEQLQQRLEASRKERITADNARAKSLQKSARLAIEEEKANQRILELQETLHQVEENCQALLREKEATVSAVSNYEATISQLNSRLEMSEATNHLLQNEVDGLERSASNGNEALQMLTMELEASKADIDSKDRELASKARELEKLRAREEQSKKVFRRKDKDLHSMRRFQQKKMANMRRAFKGINERLNAKATELEVYNQRLERRICVLDPQAKVGMQYLHDKHKENEARRERDVLSNARSNVIRIEAEVKHQNELIHRLETRLASNQPALASRRESDELVTLRTELKNKNEKIKRLRIQVSNAQASRRGGGLGPFAPPRRRG